jgi:hypothetical protein
MVLNMPDSRDGKLDLKLVPCSRCKNPFLIPRKKIDEKKELVCDNCIKIDQRKRDLQKNVMENMIKVENQMEQSVVFMKNQLIEKESSFNKQYFMDQIKKRAKMLSKSIELLEKIEDTNDEKYIKEYIDLFEKMKEGSD